VAVQKKTLLELRDAWGFSLVQLRHALGLQHVVNVEYDPIYFALHSRSMTHEQAEQLLCGIYLLTGTQYSLEDIDIQVEGIDE
jgi:hypothetical protein